MKIDGVHHRSIVEDGAAVRIIDQSLLPWRFATLTLADAAQLTDAIRTMKLRGAPLIGVAGAYALAMALRDDASDAALTAAFAAIDAARPTAVNLRWALVRVRDRVAPRPPAERAAAAWQLAGEMADEDVRINQAIGAHGAALLARAQSGRQRRLQVLTHCNAGWIATVDFGTALSAIYQAHDAGVPLHVWVDETRPRNQGLLTAWELAAHGVPHTLIADNAGGLLMQQGKIDCVLVGADRVSRAGDVCNKIGTYLKALAAHAHDVPFYAAVPSPTIDWSWAGLQQGIEIEERVGDELRVVHGLDARGVASSVRIATAETPVANPAFDVTPTELVTGIVTERGVAKPSELAALFAQSHAR
jgi:methylthioribose-1-phosphate isomerase